MVSLERAINKVLSDWGHDIFLQRKTAEGWERHIERHTVRHMYPATRGLPGVQQEYSEGIARVVDLIYYFRADAKPREGDRIYELDPRYPENGNQTIWRIDYALSMRGKGGRIVYYTVGVTRESPN